MKIPSIMFAGFFAIGVLFPLGSLGDERHERWVVELGAQDFQARSKAMEEIWKSGEESLVFLEELSRSDDPELVARAKSIIQKIKLGITPVTPERVVKLIDLYLKETPKGRIAVIEKLRDLKEFEYLLKLRRNETDERVVERLDGMITQIMPRVVREFLNEKKFAEAKEVLSLSNQYQYIIQYADLLQNLGELDEAVEKLKDPKTPEEVERYLAFLRVKGDPGLLRQEAKRLGDQTAEVLAALVMGDHVPYFEYLLARTSDARGQAGSAGLSLASQHYLKWALANHRGDTQGEKKEVDALEYLGKQLSEEEEARVNLFRMGLGDQVIESLDEDFLQTKINYHLMQENYAEARDLIGLPATGPLDEWIKETATKAEKEFKRNERGSEVGRLIAAVEFLEARGLVEEATKGAEALFDRARGKVEVNLSNLGREMFFSAPISVLTAFAREIEEHEALPVSCIKALSSTDDQHLWLYQAIQKAAPELGVRELLLHTFSFSGRQLLVPVKKHEEIFDLVLKEVMKSEEPLEGLDNLYQIVVYRNRESELRRVTEAQAQSGSENGYLRAMLAIDSGRLEDALPLIEDLKVDSDEASASFLYRHGLLLKQLGKEGGDELLKQANLIAGGSGQSLQDQAEQYLRFGEIEKSHELLKMALLRSQVVPAPGDYSSLNAVLDGLSAGAATLGRWQEALAYREALAMISSYGGESNGVYYMRDRFQVLVARGALAMKNGKIESAVAAFSEAHEILPRDGYLANELFPVMRELGLSERHDQLFAESARHAREVIKLFPKDDNAHNNFAWLASRANRCLDEAEGYLKIALELNPQSAAYLDTMGEIYFARRDRNEALKWSRRSLENEVFGRSSSRWELHQQNRRFKSGEFPAR